MTEFEEKKAEDLTKAITAFSKSESETLELRALDKESRKLIHEHCDTLQLTSTSHVNHENSQDLKDVTILRVPKKFVYSEGAMDYFAKMARVHIPVPSPEFLDYYVETQAPYSDAREMKTLFEHDMVHLFMNSINKMKSHGHRIMEEMKKAFQQETTFQEFLQLQTSPSKGLEKLEALYQPNNAQKTFVSVDIRSANYTMLKRHMPLFLSGSWEDFVGRFTQSNFLIRSKQFREVVFGNLGVNKRVESLSASYIQSVVAHLAKHITETHPIVFQKGDEVVFEVPSPAAKSDILAAMALESCPGCPEKELKVTCFSLRRLGSHAHYVREYDTGAVEFKGVSKKLKMQAIKFYQGLPCTEQDRLFVDEGELACYVHDYYSK